MRILAVNLPRFLGSLISEIVSRRAGLEIVGEAADHDMLSAITRLHPDVVVLGHDNGDNDEARALLRASHPTLRVVFIDRDGHKASVQEPGGAMRKDAEVSPEALLEMLSSRH